MTEVFDVVVVGAGQAGLAVSHELALLQVPHLVLERGRIGESWRSQRWDSFHLNTPNWANPLTGSPFHPEAPDAFAPRDEVVSYLEAYAHSSHLPVREQSRVTALERAPDGYAVHLEGETFAARAAVIATGAMSQPKVPPMAGRVAAEILSLSAGEYRNPAALPDGGVVVVGTGQSGCQIAEDLLAAGRRVYVCASRVGRVPRSYRGRDILAWWQDMGFLDVRVDELEDPAVQFAAQPQVSGTQGGHTVSLQALCRDGACLLGRVTDVDGFVLALEPNLHECIAFADDKARTFTSAIDTYIEKEGIRAAPPEPDPGEPQLPDLGGSDRVESLDLKAHGVGTVIWCTGFEADWSWVKLDVFDERGRPRHHDGVTDSPGLYFVGLPWLAKRKSGILYGVSEDASRIARHLVRSVLKR